MQAQQLALKQGDILVVTQKIVSKAEGSIVNLDEIQPSEFARTAALEGKKDAPSGTAVSIQRIVAETGKVKPEINSVREGDTIGTHVLLLDGQDDTMMLVHDAKNRRGFAEGAVRAAEWLKGKSGFYEFRKIFRELPK